MLELTRRMYGDPGGSRTPNPQIRSLMLYPVELRGRVFNNLRETLLGSIRLKSERFAEFDALHTLPPPPKQMQALRPASSRVSLASFSLPPQMK